MRVIYSFQFLQGHLKNSIIVSEPSARRFLYGTNLSHTCSKIRAFIARNRKRQTPDNTSLLYTTRVLDTIT